MSKTRRYITAGGTLACALGIGYLMQAGAVPDARIEHVGAPTYSDRADIPRTPVLPAAMADPTPLPNARIIVPVTRDESATTALPKEDNGVAFACGESITAAPVEAAMVEIRISSPCRINEKFTLHHNGMMFSAVTDNTGTSVMTVPALNDLAVFISSFDDGSSAVATVRVNDLDAFDRFVVQWRGAHDLKIHATESFGESVKVRQVSEEKAQEMKSTERGEGGFISRLGMELPDSALRAEVYSFPTGVAKSNGKVSVHVEAEVTSGNCGRDLEAQTISLSTERRIRTQDFVLAMPDCNGVGDFLVLKNLFNDLMIARN